MRTSLRKSLACSFDVYNELGHGFLESVYEEAFGIALTEAGISVQQQVPIKVWFRGRRVGDFKADMLADGKVLLELRPPEGLILPTKSSC